MAGGGQPGWVLRPRPATAESRRAVSPFHGREVTHMTRAKKLYTVLLTSGWLVALVLAAQAGPIRNGLGSTGHP